MSRELSRPIPLIVGLTTMPSRIEYIRPALDSLMGQTFPPDRILLSLPAFSQREGVPYFTPPWLAEYAPVLEVVSGVNDDGPGTKLLGALDRADDPCCLVIADDDMIYRPEFLEHLYAAQIREKGSSFSYYTYRCGPVTVGQGADGFSFYSPNLADIRSYARKALPCLALRLIDDLWISGYLYRHGIAVKSLAAVMPEGLTVYEESHSLQQLHNLDGELGRRILLVRGLDFMLMRGLLGRRHQILAFAKSAVRGLSNRPPSTRR